MSSIIEIRRRNSVGQKYAIDYSYDEGRQRTVIRAAAEVVSIERGVVEYRVTLENLEHHSSEGLRERFSGIVYRVTDDDGAISASDIRRPRGFAKLLAENENGNLVQLMGDRAQPPREPVTVGEAWPARFYGWRCVGLEGNVAHAVQLLEQPSQGLSRLECEVFVDLADGFAGRRTCTETISGSVLRYSLDVKRLGG